MVIKYFLSDQKSITVIMQELWQKGGEVGRIGLNAMPEKKYYRTISSSHDLKGIFF